ncbi:MAG: alpha/beta hydrolase [Sphingopyxis sp.]|nr:alpha/beta hydrolase [Sphingopyxis sp.]
MSADNEPLTLPPWQGGDGSSLNVTRWLPQGEPKAVVLLAHGYAEHAGRYGYVAARLTAAGYAVYAVDHWGHGRSSGTMGYVPAFSLYTDGMAALISRVRDAWPGKPRLLLGHSMGGLIAALLLPGHQRDFAAAALSGPAILTAKPPSKLTIWISRFLSRYFPRAGVIALEANGVSRDPAVVAAYLADPFVHKGKMSARLAAEMFDAMATARDGAGEIDLPLLLQHGADDRLTAPEGSRFLFDHVASTDKRLEIYPGLFHEIYNEPERDAVLGDLIQWFDAHVKERDEP